MTGFEDISFRVTESIEKDHDHLTGPECAMKERGQKIELKHSRDRSKQNKTA